MPTLKEAIEAKIKLEQDILGLIREFEFEFAYDVGVTDIRLIRSQTFSDPTERTVAVEVMVEV